MFQLRKAAFAGLSGLLLSTAAMAQDMSVEVYTNWVSGGESAALNAIASGLFSPDDKHRYAQLVDALTYYDHFLVTKDFDGYAEAQRRVDARWRDQRAWRRSAILNTARVAWFSSDRTIREYAEEIWNVPV